MKGKKNYISREDRNIRNNLVKFADNLHYVIYQHLKNNSFDEKWVKSATEWKCLIKNTPSC